MAKSKWASWLSLITILCIAAPARGVHANLEANPTVLPGLVENPLSALPLPFEPNVGQSSPGVRFVARGATYDAFLTDEGASIVLGKLGARCCSVVQLRTINGRKSRPIALDPLPGTVNYLIGDDPAGYSTDINPFTRVKYESVYPGIDVVYHGAHGGLEYDLVVAPKADPGKIDLEFRGAKRIELSGNGGLVLHTAAGSAEFRKPVAYQDVDGEKRIVEARYRFRAHNRVGFSLGRYDVARPLVIDPILAVSTNLWGAASGVALDSAGNIYVVGYTTKSDLLPVAGGYQTQVAGSQDAYVAKLNPSASSAIYTTYLGARRATTAGLGIAVDASGSVYVTGTTSSTSFPITPGAYRGAGPAFVTKLNPAGNALVYSTYVESSVSSIAVDSAGAVYMTGTTNAITTTPGAFQVAKLGATSPYIGKLNATGTAMVYATYLGGSANDEAKSIAVDATGNAYIAGTARSNNFPTLNALRPTLSGPTDAFVAKLNPSGTALVYSTYLGGSVEERGFGVAVDAAGEAVVVGWTQSNDFPVTPGVFQSRIGYFDPANHSISNAFVTKLDAAGGLVYSSYLGGKWCLTATDFSCFGFFGADEGIDAATSVAIDAAGYVYIGGYATSTEFPQVDPMQDVGVGDNWHVPLVARVAPAGDRLIFAVVLGIKSQDAGLSQIAIDGSGGVVAVGNMAYEIGLFPLTPDTVRGVGEAYAFKLAPGLYPTTLKSSINPSGATQPITLTAYALNPGAGALVTFKDGANPLGTASVVKGAAALNVSLVPGIHRITATNSADGKVSPVYFQIVGGQ